MFIQTLKNCLLCNFNDLVMIIKFGYTPVKNFKKCHQKITELRRVGQVDENDFSILYGLYKQAKFGDCEAEDDEGLTVEQIKRRESWKKLKGMSPKKAIFGYISHANKIIANDNTAEMDTNSGVFSRVLIIESQDNFEYDYFFNMVAEGDIKNVKDILKKNPKLVSLKSPEGLTPLHLASDRGNLDLVKFLLENGANINAVDENGDTPLHVAVQSQVDDVIKYLIDCGSDVNFRNFEGVSSKDLMDLEYKQ